MKRLQRLCRRDRGNTEGLSGSDPGNPIPIPPLAPGSNLVSNTVTPEKVDPLRDDMGSTRIIEGQSDASVSSVNLGSASNHTELSPSRVLGKDITKLGDYELLKKLGEGAMGAVYKATQVSIEGVKLDKPRTVALKVLFSHVANNPKLVARLYREGQVMGKLDHPNIITATAIGEADGCHYVAMEYVSGLSMQRWMTQLGRIPVADAVRVTLECAKALTYAHGLNMVHRDIKPDNILLTKTGFVKVADLGMVKIEDEEMSLTQTGHAVGTPWFMPLEQAKNAKDIDGRSDIYALGCTLYAFLTGKPPFMGRTIVEVVQAKGQGTFPPARQVNPDVPERLDLIIIKATAKEPKNRYQKCEELIKDLESLGIASETLSFVAEKKPIVKENTASDGDLAKTTMLDAVKTSTEHAFGDIAAPAILNPNAWYVQMRLPDGALITRRYSTAQLVKMLEDGTISATAKASHNETDGFRGLGTYREFQGAAMSKIAKKAMDKNTARTRGMSKRIEEEDRLLAEKERKSNEPETALQANLRYYFGMIYQALPIVLLVLIFIGVLYAASAETGWNANWWAPAVPGAGLLLYLIQRFFSSGR
jgi:eukaryotic-like serine/threonine-protein kinase